MIVDDDLALSDGDDQSRALITIAQNGGYSLWNVNEVFIVFPTLMFH